tara:strand:- start:1766 stop:2920 length:1155 start_codon:yes stop_codon:yes gene_type:complete
LIPYGKHDLTEKDINRVLKVLKSDFLTQGPEVEKFEKNISLYCKNKYSVAVNSATSALHISCLALGLGKGDYLWTSAISFVASSNCALYCGAKVDFVDIDPDTYNLCPNKLEEKLKVAKKEDRLPKILVPVHLSGQPADLQKIKNLSNKYNFKIIEDASHAIGAEFKGNLIGDCKYSDVCVFSFHPVKIITSAEGGMALTNNKDTYEKMKILRTHGITRDKNKFNTSYNPSIHYEQIDLGFNYRMNDLQAALGSSQLKNIDEKIKKRREIASFYDEKLADLPMKIPFQIEDRISSYHLYIIKLDEDLKVSKEELIKHFKKNGVYLSFHYMPIFLHKYYENRKYLREDFPEAMSYYKNALSIPIYPKLSKKDQKFIINLFKKYTY